MDTSELHDHIYKKFVDLLLEFFDYKPFGRWGASGPVFDAELSLRNSSFIKSGYYYDANFEFIHFTSTRNLFSILNERSLRFYNLLNSKDPEEYNEAAKILIDDENEIEHKKRYMYTFSFCPIEMLKNKYIWEKYGSNYEGLAIKFAITNEPKEWINYHLSEIKYEQNEKIKKFSEKKKELENEFNIVVKVDLSRYLGFHKTSEWTKEKEVRLLTYFPFNRFQEYEKFSKVEYIVEKNRNRFSEYIQLPLWVDNSSVYIKSDELLLDKRINVTEKFFIESPKIIIKDIYWGNNMHISIEELSTLSKRINELILSNFGYRINVSSSFIDNSDHK